MKRSTARWSTALAAAAWLALPIGSAAQTPGSQQPEPQQPATQPPTTQQPTAGAHAQHDQHGVAQEHLQKAEAALDDIPAASLAGGAKSRVAELKRHLNAVERAAGDKASATGAEKRSERGTAASGQGDWSKDLAAADRILTELLSTPSTSAAGEATGTTGTTGSTKSKSPSTVTLDETTRAKLMEVRSHLTAFAAAMSGTSSPSTPGAAADTASAQPSSTSATTSNPSTTATGSTGSPSSTTGSTTNTGMTGNVAGTEQPPTMSPGAQQPGAQAQTPAGQVDPEAAKQHLTAARNTLSELTQLPAAAQLSGEPRTQISQLISNFNELITTDAEWRESYAKVEANLTALIGPPTAAQTTDEPQTPPAPSPTEGAVGTTGTAAGLDPAIRAKLVEFRSHLDQFEKAAGGAASPGEAAASSTANPESMTNPGSTANPTGSAYPSSPATSTPGTTPEQTAGAAQSSTQPGSQQPSETEGHNEAMQHIAAIEAILNGQSAGSPSAASPTGTTGSTAGNAPTLDKSHIEQIRTHLAELRKLLAAADR